MKATVSLKSSVYSNWLPDTFSIIHSMRVAGSVSMLMDDMGAEKSVYKLEMMSYTLC